MQRSSIASSEAFRLMCEVLRTGIDLAMVGRSVADADVAYFSLKAAERLRKTVANVMARPDVADADKQLLCAEMERLSALLEHR